MIHDIHIFIETGSLMNNLYASLIHSINKFNFIRIIIYRHDIILSSTSLEWSFS